MVISVSELYSLSVLCPLFAYRDQAARLAVDNRKFFRKDYIQPHLNFKLMGFLYLSCVSNPWFQLEILSTMFAVNLDQWITFDYFQFLASAMTYPLQVVSNSMAVSGSGWVLFHITIFSYLLQLSVTVCV